MKRRLKRLIQQPLIIQPGDTLIVRIEQPLSQAMAAEIKDRLIELIPELANVVVIGPCSELAVYRP